MKHAFLIIAHNEVMTFICILTNGLQNCFSK